MRLATIQKLRANGKTFQQIADKLGISRQSVWCRVNREKVNASRKNPKYRAYMKAYMDRYNPKYYLKSKKFKNRLIHILDKLNKIITNFGGEV